MKCYACGSGKIIPGMGQCPVCRFQVLYSSPAEDPQEKEQADEKRRSLGKRYLKNRLNGISLELVTFQYAIEEDEIRPCGESRRHLADCGSLSPGEIKWLEQDFAQADLERISLNVFLQNRTENHFKKLTADAPKTEGFWHVGVLLEEECRVSLVLGEPKSFTRTEVFSIL